MRVRGFVDAKINSRLLFTTAIWLDSSVRHCTNFLIDEIGGRSFTCKLDETRVREKSKRVEEFRLPCFTASQTSFYDPLVNRKTKNARNYGSFRSKGYETDVEHRVWYGWRICENVSLASPMLPSKPTPMIDHKSGAETNAIKIEVVSLRFSWFSCSIVRVAWLRSSWIVFFAAPTVHAIVVRSVNSVYG